MLKERPQTIPLGLEVHLDDKNCLAAGRQVRQALQAPVRVPEPELGLPALLEPLEAHLLPALQARLPARLLAQLPLQAQVQVCPPFPFPSLCHVEVHCMAVSLAVWEVPLRR